jgi:predicted lipoprotein
VNNLKSVNRGVCIALLFLLAACGGDSADVIINNPSPGGNPDPAPTGFDASEIIMDIGEGVIIPTYQGMADATGKLLATVTVLADGNLTRSNLEAAQSAWYEARKYWESSEGFLWGPIDTEGFDPKLDDWPVNKVDLDNILADQSVDLGNQGVIDQLETTVKGFHTIEYILFNDGTGNEDTAGCGAAEAGTEACYNNILAALANPRRIEYLHGIAVNVDTVANQTIDAWLASDGNFIEQVVSAGKGSTLYPSQSAMLEEVVQGMIGIADEVAAGKLGDPFGAGNPLTVESKFSGNSLTDFQFNIRSLRNLYCGRESIGTESAVSACGTSGNSGLAGVVSENDNALHQEVLAAIDAAVMAIADIPGPYYKAVEASTSDPALAQTIQKAIDAVKNVMNLMQGDVLPLLNEVDFAY